MYYGWDDLCWKVGILQLSRPEVDKSKFLDTCPIHSHDHGNAAHGQVKGWAEKESGAPLPNVIVGMTTLAPNIKSLIKSHGGSLNLSTLKTCYEAEFKPLEVDKDNGVPLEHLGKL